MNPIRRCYRRKGMKDTFIELYNTAFYRDMIVIQVKWWNVNSFNGYSPFPITGRLTEHVFKKDIWDKHFKKIDWKKAVSE